MATLTMNGVRTAGRTEKKEEATESEKLHNARMDEYRKVLYSGLDLMESEVVSDAVAAPAAPAQKIEPLPEMPVYNGYENTNAAERMKAYHAYPAPATRRNLFEGIALKNGELVIEAPVEEEKAPTASVAASVAAPAAPVALPDLGAENEDSLPTQKTMSALNAARAEAQTAAANGFFAQLSAKTRIVLLTIAIAVVMALTIICINTAIINSLNAQVEQRETTVNALREESERLREAVSELTDPENIAEWAMEHGMTRS